MQRIKPRIVIPAVVALACLVVCGALLGWQDADPPPPPVLLDNPPNQRFSILLSQSPGAADQWLETEDVAGNRVALSYPQIFKITEMDGIVYIYYSAAPVDEQPVPNHAQRSVCLGEGISFDMVMDELRRKRWIKTAIVIPPYPDEELPP